MGSKLPKEVGAALFSCIAALSCVSAKAQEGEGANAPAAHAPVVSLGPVEVEGTVSRLGTKVRRAPARQRAPRVRPTPTRSSAPPAPSPRPVVAAPATGETGGGAEVAVPSGIVTGTIVTGASTTVITANDIARSPGHSLQDILSREPGVQVTNLFGGVNGARSQIDLRGFGATAASNTLILINGRRITDLDLVGFDLASIPRESIDHIEITRGNSGVVLYGDGAVGGVVNIVTKTGVALPAKARSDYTFGSFKYREGNASVTGSNGPWSASIYSNAINSDGYRVNNFYRQLNGVGDFRYTTEEGSAYLNLSADSSHLGLPGARRVDPSLGINQLVTDRQGATTPFDWAEKKGRNATLGVTRLLAPGIELIVDGGVRQKQELAAFFFATPTLATLDPRAAVDTTLTTSSVTPRVKIDAAIAGMPWKALGGFDWYRAVYHSDRPLFLGATPIHMYDLAQTTFAAYWQQTVSVQPNTDLGIGGRIQGHTIYARDRFDVNAPGGQSCFPPFGCFPNDVEALPFDQHENNRAYHLGFEHRFSPAFAVFGRMAQSFRVPNVDERVGTAPILGSDLATFNLRTQKSHDYETGVRVRVGRFEGQWSIYDMYLVDEIMFRFAPNFIANNINLDPTRRYGQEAIAGLWVNDRVRLKGGLAYTRAVFREGPFAGNDVPLVSRWTGSVGLAWDICPKWLSFDGVVRYIGARRMDNDQRNLQPLVPAHALVDVGLGGEIDRFFWSVKVQNLFNADYFDYAIASPFPDGPGSKLGTYNAYPQPGRTFLAKAGAVF
jgi:iron complex outermembrane recepter protein